ncbi:hypothetical protein [uncultured Azonexus sp.]|uniref:hypothetical protein n=1 Tax=uncultured Azonexus sp. TaxID=520307 RepID=UPI002617DC88|nr:hypothetical protein [uncultured Azonexus sp.]MCA1938949.1 hypothetical protein [Dechloromonas sp.]
MKKPLLLSYALAGLLLATGTQAAPAPWHWWVSKADGARICMQTPPGEGWAYSRGPYRDARCTLPARR